MDVFAESAVVSRFALRPRTTEHIVHFYGDEEWFLRELADYLGEGITNGASTIIVATAEHRREVNAILTSRGLPVDGARRSGLYVEADAAGVLAQFRKDGGLDPVRFADVIGTMVVAGMGPNGDRPVRAFGEMVALLCFEGRYELARMLEELWVALARRLSFSLLCAYPSGLFRDDRRADDLGTISALHERVVRTGYPAPATPSRES